MSRKLAKFKSKAMFTFVGGVLVINPAFGQDATAQAAPANAAQSTPQQSSDQATTLDTVVVSGIRNSLEHSMGIKRDAVGVVDAISAEDIGKFPDTNLAESMQRITGISIDRRDGEGAQVTARGFGPEYNMVTLNGRQIPGADGFGSGAAELGETGSGTRAFNFAQLASEAISGVVVHKTGQAGVPSGGIGATIDIQTARPLDRTGTFASVGMKAVSDQSQVLGSEITPEMSGIFSYSNPDKTWGFGVSGSYQKRHGGSVQATENGWNVSRWTGSLPNLRPGGTVENAPQVGQLYSMPNDLRYAFQDFERTRVNGQAVLQFAPTDAFTFTLDYTYSTNEIAQNRGEQTMWLQNSLDHVTFDGDSQVATPIYIRDIAGSSKDFGFEQQHNEQKYKLGSLGFNAVWNVNDRFSLTFDGHNTKVRSLPNDPLTGGSSTAFSLAGVAPDRVNNNFSQEYWFNGGLPIMSPTLYPTTADALAGTNGTPNPAFPPSQLGSQILRIWSTRQDSEVKQGRIDGALDFDSGRFTFGVDSSEVSMRRLNVDGHGHLMTLGNWGVDDAGQVADMAALLKQINIVGLFDDFNASGASPNAWWGNASALAQWAADKCASGTAPAAWAANCGSISAKARTTYDSDNLIEEKTQAAYVQWDQDFNIGSMPAHLAVGARYEKTDITSTSMIQIPSAVRWMSNNDFGINLSAEKQPFSEKASYNYLLPNLDFSIDLTEDIKARASISKTIARAPYGNLYAGATPGGPSGSVLFGDQYRGGGSSNNPSLLPLESRNIDLGAEWYFAPSSFVGVTYWRKKVDNFVGNTVVRQNLYGLTDPTSGPDAQAALAFLNSPECVAQVTAAGGNPAEGCVGNYTTLFTALAMLRNPGSGGLAAYNGSNPQQIAMESAYDIVGEADDPLYQFDVNVPVNQRSANLHGWEIGGQYFFGDSGFGILANYTIVKGDVGVDRAADPGANVFALVGLSDSANAVLMYEKHGWSARLAWNWRDEYLMAANQNGNNRNPYFVEAYQQIDANVSYDFTDQFTVSFEAINLTGEDVRWHARSENQMVRAVEQSPRYMLGFRFKF
ncbi:TonB-dependent receptor [Pseudoxanthomonas helianthi]|uniref:TonB-dependent receptor n=1 Tax=Pseudoxanthomonas helianthi TaxID=1453541 RepID=A0A940WZZ5_9GAMM|nr:TonB-dependent receptor [Pseudoxanthomonas helianthi]MBP3983337.1 TonB-dependent receptor [Pseudoxanthomonas helianthi]